MILHVKPSRLNGSLAVPGSKSHTIRGVLCGIMADGVSVLKNPLESDDTRAAAGAARSIGAEVRQSGDHWEIRGCGGRFSDPRKTIDMLNSGTSLRLFFSAGARQDFPLSFDGDASLRTRKMAPLIRTLETLGCVCTSTEGHCPVSIRGPVKSGRAFVDGTSSQFLSSLLFSLPFAEGEFELDLELLNERPYVGITLSWLDFLGIKYEVSPDWLHWKIRGGQRIAPFTRAIPADFSTAAFPLAAGVLAGGEVRITNLDFSDCQGDKAVFDLFREMGADLDFGDVLTVRGGTSLRPGTFDLNATPDALPIMAVAAAYARGETRLVNAPQARIKETDRIAVMARELPKMGALVEELPDGLVIRGTGHLHGSTELESCGDHRIVMALAVAALAAEGESAIRDAECAGVTYPGFFSEFQALGADFRLS